METLSIYDLFSKETSKTRLPVLMSPSPHRRTKSISKTKESRFILSNSVNESFPLSQPRSPLSSYPKRGSLLKHSIEEPMEQELRRAIRTIISKKPKIRRLAHKNTVINSHIYTMKNIEEQDINNFVKAIFSHEPSPFRKLGLTAEPKTLDLRAAEKILQEAKKIIRHGVMKKNDQYESKTQIEDFWKNHISKEENVRWDIFEEGLLSFIENFMVSNHGVLRKINWKAMLGKIYSSIAVESTEVEIWPPGKGHQELILTKVAKFTDFAIFVAQGRLQKILMTCIEELPFYIENLRGNAYDYVCGCHYKGEWKDGKREGNGIFEMCSGESFFGNFFQGLRQEFGTFKGNGFLYKGDFKKDKFHGYGILKFPNGNSYDGMWIKHRFLKGKFLFHDQSFYVGDWNAQEFEGRGKLVVFDGTVKKGMWRAGKLCGDGSVKGCDGRVLRGFFLDDALQSEYQE